MAHSDVKRVCSTAIIYTFTLLVGKGFSLVSKEANMQILEFRTFLPNHLMKFKNLLAWQQCWLISPKRNNKQQSP